MATYDVKYILKLRDMMSAKLKQADANTKNLNMSVNKLKASMGGLGTGLAGVFAVGAGVTAGKEIIETTARMEALQAAIKFASGSAEEFARNQAFLRRKGKELRLEAFASAEGFKTLLGSLKGSNLTGEDARNVFDAVATAARTMGLSAEQQKGAFTALGQIISKGKVQAEELRGQLGERIPGAFAIAAKSLGMTTKELDKALEQGQVSAEQFIKNFAVTLKQEFEVGIPGATQTLTANLVDLQNKVTDLKLALGQELVGSTNDVIGSLGNLLEKLTANAGLIIKIGKVALKLAAIFIKIRLAIIAVRAAQVAWNASMVLGSRIMQLNRLRLIAMGRGLKSMIRLLKLGKIAMRGLFGGAIGIAVFAGLDLLISKFDLLISKFMGVKDEIASTNEEFQKFKELAEKRKSVRDVVSLVKEGKLTDVSRADITEAIQFLQTQKEGLKRTTGKIQVPAGFGPMAGGLGQQQLFREETDAEQKKRSMDQLKFLRKGFNEDITALQSALERMTGPANGVNGTATTAAGVTEIKAAAPKIFNLNIDKLVESLTVQSATLEEGAERVKEIIEEVLLTALADSQKSIR
jgi:tape measure domain-containing protein